MSDYEEEKVTAVVSVGVTRYLSYKGRIQDFQEEIKGMKDKEIEDVVGCFIIRRDKASQPSLRNVRYLQTLQQMNKDLPFPILLVLSVPPLVASQASSWIISMSYNAYCLSPDSNSVLSLPVHIVTSNGSGDSSNGAGNIGSNRIDSRIDESVFNFNSFSLYSKDEFDSNKQRKANLDIVATADTFIHTMQKLDDIKGEILQVIDLENEVSELRQKVEKMMSMSES